MNRASAIDILAGRDRSMVAHALRGLTRLAEPAYRAAVARRNAAFDTGKRPAADLGRPTLSVGNLTTGGTGKTPHVIDLAQRLQAMGQRPAVLLRGYKAEAGTSDEALELRQSLPGVPIIPNPSRIEGAKTALTPAPPSAGPASAGPETTPNPTPPDLPTCFLLDDGFQHRQAGRDLDLVLIDATGPWGFGHLLPRGLLREPKQNLSRADAVIITRADQVPPEQVAALDHEITQLTGKPPLAHSAHMWTGLRYHDQRLPLDHLATRRAFAVSAIGNPDAFERTLAQHCREVVAAERRADHHAYTAGELAALIQQAVDAGTDAIVTTEKDYVKWRPLLAAGEPAVPILRPELGITYLDGEAALEDRLSQAIAIQS